MWLQVSSKVSERVVGLKRGAHVALNCCHQPRPRGWEASSDGELERVELKKYGLESFFLSSMSGARDGEVG